MRHPASEPISTNPRMRHSIDLIFDKSSLESLNLDEAIMLDNFYMSDMTPLFFVECLADLEKAIRSKSTPEQLVGSLASRTPESQSYPNVHHSNILRGELAGRFDLTTVRGRVVLAGGRHVLLADKKGVVFERSGRRWRSSAACEREEKGGLRRRRSEKADPSRAFGMTIKS